MSHTISAQDLRAKVARIIEKAGSQAAEAAQGRLALELAGMQQLLASPGASAAQRPAAPTSARSTVPAARPSTGRGEIAGGAPPVAQSPTPAQPTRFSLLEVD